MRMPKADLSLIDRAATVRGRSRTDFVREAAVRAAEEVLLERAFVRMGAADFKAFSVALARPGRVVPALVQVFSRRAPWEPERH